MAGVSAEWRTDGKQDAVLVVDDTNVVRAALTANQELLSIFLTDMRDLEMWHRASDVAPEKRSPSAWGELVIARAQSGEVLNMDPRLFWDGIYTWFRSRGVDYDTGRL